MGETTVVLKFKSKEARDFFIASWSDGGADEGLAMSIELHDESFDDFFPKVIKGEDINDKTS